MGYVKVIAFLVSFTLLSLFNGCNDKFSDVYNYTDVDVRPKPIYITQPVYPEQALKLEQEGHVDIRAIVELDSTIGYTEVEISSGYPLLDSSALDAARTSLFEPAINDSEPVRCWIAIPFNFQLE